MGCLTRTLALLNSTKAVHEDPNHDISTSLPLCPTANAFVTIFAQGSHGPSCCIPCPPSSHTKQIRAGREQTKQCARSEDIK